MIKEITNWLKSLDKSNGDQRRTFQAYKSSFIVFAYPATEECLPNSRVDGFCLSDSWGGSIHRGLDDFRTEITDKSKKYTDAADSLGGIPLIVALESDEERHWVGQACYGRQEVGIRIPSSAPGASQPYCRAIPDGFGSTNETAPSQIATNTSPPSGTLTHTGNAMTNQP